MQTPTQYEDDYDDDGLGAGSLAAMLGAGAMATPLGRPVRKLVGKANAKLRDPAGKAAAAMSSVTKPAAELLKKHMGGGALDRAGIAANDAARARGGNPAAFGEVLDNAADTYKGGQAGLQSLWASMKGAKPNLADSVNSPPASTAMAPSTMVPPNVQAAGKALRAAPSISPQEFRAAQLMQQFNDDVLQKAQGRASNIMSDIALSKSRDGITPERARALAEPYIRNVTPPTLTAQPKAAFTAGLPSSKRGVNPIDDVPPAAAAARGAKRDPNDFINPALYNMPAEERVAYMGSRVTSKRQHPARLESLADAFDDVGKEVTDDIKKAAAGTSGDKFKRQMAAISKRIEDPVPQETQNIMWHAAARHNSNPDHVDISANQWLRMLGLLARE